MLPGNFLVLPDTVTFAIADNHRPVYNVPSSKWWLTHILIFLPSYDLEKFKNRKER